jgi:hypothetical protein
MGSALDSPRAWNVSLGIGTEELKQQCLRKAMTAMVELGETRMCNLLGNELTQLPRNEEIIRGTISSVGFWILRKRSPAS